MTRRRPVSLRAIGQLLLAAAIAGGVVAVLGHLHASFPTRQLEPILEGIESVRGEEVDRITCRRTLPDRPSQARGENAPDLVGLVRSGEVVSCPDLFDPEDTGGPTVRYVGEVVGDVLERGDGAWVLMNDDGYALESGPLPAHDRYQGTNTGLSVWLPREAIETSEVVPGRPDRRGDVLLVSGSIHRTDPADGGGLTLRATTAEVVAPARELPQPIHGRQAALAALLALAAGGLALYVRSAEHPGSGI